MPMKSLNEFRKDIDQINQEILDQLIQRYTICKHIAQLKSQDQLPFRDPMREVDILQKMVSQSPLDQKTFIEKNFKNLLATTLEYMKEIEEAK